MGKRVDRRAFLLGAAALLTGAACGRGAAAPQPKVVGPPDAPALDLYGGGEPPYVGAARAWVAAIPAVAMPRAKALLPDDMQKTLETGFIALSDVCPRDQIQLVFCKSAGWFECPNCGSRFDGLGSVRGGPTPAGMTMLRVSVDDAGEVSVHPHPNVPGLPPGTYLVQHDPTGPHCA